MTEEGSLLPEAPSNRLHTSPAIASTAQEDATPLPASVPIAAE